MKELTAFYAGLLVGGVPAGLLGLGLVVLRPRRWRRRRPAVEPIALAARLLVLVGAGIPLIAALERLDDADGDVAAVVRRARRLGAAAALGGAAGPLGPLLRRLAGVVLSGAAPEPAIRGFIESERRRLHSEAIERARRLPVRLMIPMTLLVLPGFVLMVYGPTFIATVGDLVGPLAP